MVSSEKYVKNSFTFLIFSDNQESNKLIFKDYPSFEILIRVSIHPDIQEKSIMDYLTVDIYDPLYTNIRNFTNQFKTIKSFNTILIFLKYPEIRNLDFKNLVSLPRFYDIIPKIDKDIWENIKNDNFFKKFIV